MPEILFGLIIPATITGGLCTLAVIALRLFGSRLRGSVHKTAIVSAAVVYLLPLGLLFGLVRNISIPQQPSAQQNAADVTQQQESESTIGTLFEELPVTAPTYNAGKQIGDLITAADTSAGTLSNYSDNGDSGSGNNAVADDIMAGKPEAAVPGARELLILIYAAGAVIYALVVTFRYMVFQRRLRKTSYEIRTEWKLKEAQKLTAELGIKHMPLMLRNSAVSAPMITGILKPVLVLPGTLTDKKGFSLSVRHELIHYKHKDLIIKMLLLALSVAHWFNPLVHLLRYSYARCCETHCDETVARSLNSNERRIYAETLLRFADKSAPYAAAGIATPKNKIKERLKMIINPRKQRWYITLLCAVLFVTVTSFGLLVGCGVTGGGQTSEDGTVAATVDQEMIEGMKEVGDKSGIGTNEMIWPTGEGYRISRGFDQHHPGVDIAAEEGTEIYAADNGVVVQVVSLDANYGNYIVIDHQNGLQTFYAYNSTNLVQVGDIVEKGELIALMGSTGNSTGSHLHFEVSEQGIKVDPAPYIGYDQREIE